MASQVWLDAVASKLVGLVGWVNGARKGQEPLVVVCTWNTYWPLRALVPKQYSLPAYYSRTWHDLRQNWLPTKQFANVSFHYSRPSRSRANLMQDELHSNLLYHARKLTFRSDNCGASCFDLEVDIIQASVKNFVEKFRLNYKGANIFESKNPLRELLLREFFASGNLRRRMTLIFKCKSREFLPFFPFFLFLTLCENVFAP